MHSFSACMSMFWLGGQWSIHTTTFLDSSYPKSLKSVHDLPRSNEGHHHSHVYKRVLAELLHIVNLLNCSSSSLLATSCTVSALQFTLFIYILKTYCILWCMYVWQGNGAIWIACKMLVEPGSLNKTLQICTTCELMQRCMQAFFQSLYFCML